MNNVKTQTHRQKHPWAFLNNNMYTIGRLFQHFKMSRILLDILRNENEYKYSNLLLKHF